MEFGIPSKQRVKTEKYPDHAVITLHPHEGVKTSRKIEFNEKAYEVLGFKEDDNNMVAFSFDRTNLTQNLLINANDLSIDSALKIAKNGIVSNKKHYNEIKDRYDAKPSDELELALVPTERQFKGQTLYSLATLDSVFDSEIPEAGEDVTDKYKDDDGSGKEQESDDDVTTVNEAEAKPDEKEVEASEKKEVGINNVKPAPSTPVEDTPVTDAEEVKSEEDVPSKTEDEEEDDFPF